MNHTMPFLRRNLSYWREMNYGASDHKRSKATKQPVAAATSAASDKKPDLLYTIWKHRVRNYNDAFLSSPRRATRNFARACEPASINEQQPPAKKSRIEPPVDTRKIPVAAPQGRSSPIVTDKSTVTDHYARATMTASPLSQSDDSLLTWTKVASQPKQYHLFGSSGEHQHKTNVIFHYLYMDQASQQMCMQSDSSGPDGDRRCPFCNFDGGSDAGLVLHCVLCHGQTLSFKAARNEDGTLHVAAMKREEPQEESSHDFVYHRQRPDNETKVPKVPFVKRHFAATTMDLVTRRKKIRQLKDQGAEDGFIRPFFPGSQEPVRQYYHARTNEPMMSGEWEVDSDDASDDEWLHKMGEELMDEFEDVTSSEKNLMKLWNKFIYSHAVVADSAMPEKCREFIQMHVRELSPLRSDLLLHLSGLWDFGLISAQHLHDFMVDFDQLASEQEAGEEAVV